MYESDDLRGFTGSFLDKFNAGGGGLIMSARGLYGHLSPTGF